MNSVLSTGQSLMQMFNDRAKEFSRDEIDNVHMVWLEEITQEANRMFSKEFNTEPELMPKTPSQKKKTRRKRVSVGRQEENQARRRFSKGRRSNLRGSGSVKSLNFIEEETIPEASTSDAESSTKPKRATRKNKQKESEVAEDVSQGLHGSCDTAEMQDETPEPAEEEVMDINNKENNEEVQPEDTCSAAQSPPKIPLPELVVSISSSDRLSAELAKRPEPSPGRTAAKIAIAGAAQSSRRSSMRCSLKLRHSLGGLRHSMTRESMRRTSRRSMLKKKKTTQASNSTCSSEEDSSIESVEEEERAVTPEVVTADTEDNDADKESQEIPETQFKQPALLSIGRVTRSVAAASPKLALPALNIAEKTMSTPIKNAVFAEKQQTARSGQRSRQSTKRKAAEIVEQSPTRRCSPPKKPQSAIRPSMKSFLHTVQKNQMLMMAPSSLGRSGVIKSFIKHTTPLKYDPKAKERQKLEALKRKQELEEERMKKMDEEKKKKQDELKRKRDERLRRVYEAKVKEEQREEEKKKKIEQKMAQTENDKRVAEEQAKKKVAGKRQEDLEQKKKLEEESKRKRIQQAEEEKRQQEFLAKKKVEEEEQRARKQAEIRRAQELERERERMAAIERERVEREKALALQREVERAAREKERREIEERRRALEEKRRNEEQQRVAEQKAAREREAAKLREAAAAAAAAAAATAAAKQAADIQTDLNISFDIERSVIKTPVGKGGGLNVTVDIEQSPQSYSITPKGGNKPLIPSKSADDYGMDQNSDDSTDDESAPRKPIPSWAQAHNLQQMMMKQYFNPPDLYSFFGKIEPPKLENIFYKSKPRYFKRTSSAVWNSPPIGSNRK